MKSNYNFDNIRKGNIFYIPKTDFKKRIVVIDYDISYVYCIDLNKQYNSMINMAHIKRISYGELNNEWILE